MALTSLKKAVLAFLLATASCNYTPTPSRLCSHSSEQKEKDVCEQYSVVEVLNRDCTPSEITVDEIYRSGLVPIAVNQYWEPFFDLESRPNPNYAKVPPGYPEAFTVSALGRCQNDIESRTIDLKLSPSEQDRNDLWKDYVKGWNLRARKENALLKRDFLPPELASVGNLRLTYAAIPTRGEVTSIRLGRDVTYDIQREAKSPLVTVEGLIHYCIKNTGDGSMGGCDNRGGMLKFVLE